MNDEALHQYRDAPRATSQEGRFIFLGDKPFARGRSCEMWLAAAPEPDGSMRLACARVASALAREHGEPYSDFVRGVQVRATFAPTTPRLVGALGNRDGRVVVTVEEYAGDVTFHDVVKATIAQRGHVPIGVALNVGARLAALFAAADRQRVQLTVEPHDVVIGWDGAISVLAKPYPRWDQAAGGAMVGTLKGHFAWMPPERIRGHRTSARAEMYTLGILFWEALAGRHPLHKPGMSVFEQLNATIQNEAPPIRTAREDVPEEVASIVDRCTRSNDADRFSSWSELAGLLTKAHDRIERIDDAALAGTLAHLFPRRRGAALLFAEQVRLLDVTSLRASLRTTALEPVTVAALQRDDASDTANSARWADEGTSPDIDVASWGADARPMIRVDNLLVDLRPVTNAEYARFITATERAAPSHWGEGARTPPLASFDTPVTMVAIDDALSYARWARKRLPSDSEWSHAIDAVGSARLATGAVWEWTSTKYERGDQHGHVVRGGRFRDRPDLPAQPSNTSYENEPAPDVGFRCVADA